MAEVPASTSTEDSLPEQWKVSNQRSRKSGSSNILSGINLHQLHRLFRTAGEKDAEHRAKLVWQSIDTEMENVGDREQVEDEAGLAQALVGLRVRARNKAGLRVDGYRDHKFSRTSGYLKFEEPSSDYMLEDEEADLTPSQTKFLLPTQEDVAENQSSLKASSWRLGVARQEDSERYLHRILH